MAKLKEIKIREVPKNRPTKVLTINADTADLLRKVARHEGLGMTAFLDRALRAFVQLHHPDWEMVEEGGSRAVAAAALLARDLREATRGASSIFGQTVEVDAFSDDVASEEESFPAPALPENAGPRKPGGRRRKAKRSSKKA